MSSTHFRRKWQDVHNTQEEGEGGGLPVFHPSICPLLTSSSTSSACKEYGGGGGGCQKAHRGGLAVVHPQVVLDGLVDGPGAAQHAGGGATHHDVVLAHLAAIKHRVERGHLHLFCGVSHPAPSPSPLLKYVAHLAVFRRHVERGHLPLFCRFDNTVIPPSPKYRGCKHSPPPPLPFDLSMLYNAMLTYAQPERKRAFGNSNQAQLYYGVDSLIGLHAQRRLVPSNNCRTA